MLEIQKELQKKSLEEIINEYHLKASYHNKYPSLVCLKYNQLKSPFSSELVRECRGIILDIDDNYKVISYPFKKFFNYNEGYSANIDWGTARVQEKLDGSMMVLYYYDGAWQVQSSGKPDASGRVHDTDIIFHDLFWRTWNDLGYSLPKHIDKCFIFELITPQNKLLVNYHQSRIVLTGVRDLNRFFYEVNPNNYGDFYGWEIVAEYPIDNLEKAISVSNSFKANEAEGFVVVDSNFNRIKIKSKDHILWHHLSEGMTEQKILTKIINDDEIEEFLGYFPQYTGIYMNLLSSYAYLKGEIIGVYNNFKNIESQKEFAIAIKDFPYKSILFEARNKKRSVEDALRRSPVDKIYNLLK